MDPTTIIAATLKASGVVKDGVEILKVLEEGIEGAEIDVETVDKAEKVKDKFKAIVKDKTNWGDEYQHKEIEYYYKKMKTHLDEFEKLNKTPKSKMSEKNERRKERLKKEIPEETQVFLYKVLEAMADYQTRKQGVEVFRVSW